MTFASGDFSQQTVDGEQRYVATKTGPVVTITDDITVEWAEEVRLRVGRHERRRVGAWRPRRRLQSIAVDSDDQYGFKDRS